MEMVSEPPPKPMVELNKMAQMVETWVDVRVEEKMDIWKKGILNKLKLMILSGAYTVTMLIFYFLGRYVS